MICLTHPDPLAREAVLATLLALWPEAPCKACAEEEIPEDALFIFLGTPPQKLSALINQIQALNRQSLWPASLKFETAFGSRSLNTRTREWLGGEEDLVLTEKEVGVLLYLWQKKTSVTREELLRELWQYAPDADTHTIETHMYRLRQKIEPDPANPQFLITGKDGYQLAAKASA
jgi:DNA-binding response OmpR family regulator